jgi:hypothetical protein
MDTPRDAYEEAIEKMAVALCHEVRCDGDTGLFLAREAAEAIGLREMMEKATVFDREHAAPTPAEVRDASSISDRMRGLTHRNPNP